MGVTIGLVVVLGIALMVVGGEFGLFIGGIVIFLGIPMTIMEAVFPGISVGVNFVVSLFIVGIIGAGISAIFS